MTYMMELAIITFGDSMPLAVPARVQISDYTVEYQKKDEVMKVGAPNLDDAKTLFDYLWTKTGRS